MPEIKCLTPAEPLEQIQSPVGTISTLIAAQQNMRSRRLAEDELYHIQQRLNKLATIDPLTGTI